MTASFYTPDWVKQAVFYQIFPDRFALPTSPASDLNLEPWDAPPTLEGFKGGHLDGVTAKLDYLADLGITALYFTPIFQSCANHRYHTHDYFRVDPLLGGNKAFERCLNAAHDRGIKVVLDGVFNHASRGFFQFNHTLENGSASPYKDWFHFNEAWLESGQPLDAYAALPRRNAAPDQEESLARHGYRAWWDLPALPKFNTAHPGVREFIMEVAEYWLEFGIDGWRLDVPHEVEGEGFWQEFRKRVRTINPEAYICGEIWTDASSWLQGDQFDAVMNYQFSKPALGTCFANSLRQDVLATNSYRDVAPMTVAELSSHLAELFKRYPIPATYAQMNLLGSHDTPRIWTLGGEDEAGVKLAMALMFIYPGAPCVFYGDEIGLAGVHDPDCRRGFPWHDEASWRQDLRQWIKKLAAIKQEPALVDGDFRIDHHEDCLWGTRQTEGQQLVWCLNFAEHAQIMPPELSQLVRERHPTLSSATLPEATTLAARSAALWL